MIGEDDTNYDSLGFAMKLFDVDGERLLSELESTTQDFILSSNPTFFVHEMDGNDILDILHRTDVYSFLQWTIPRPWHFMSIFKLFASWIRGLSLLLTYCGNNFRTIDTKSIAVYVLFKHSL